MGCTCQSLNAPSSAKAPASRASKTIAATNTNLLKNSNILTNSDHTVIAKGAFAAHTNRIRVSSREPLRSDAGPLRQIACHLHLVNQPRLRVPVQELPV